MLVFKKSTALSSTVTSQKHGIIKSPLKMMKNTCVTVVTKFQTSNLLQRKDIEILMQKVAKQWKLRSNGHLIYENQKDGY